MRLSERMKRPVTVRPAAATSVYQADGRLYRFDDTRTFTIRAAIQPMTEQTAAAVYGETHGARLMMFYDGDEQLTEGMGVCVETAADSACDYHIAEMPRRYPGHQEFTLAFIPLELRG